MSLLKSERFSGNTSLLHAFVSVRKRFYCAKNGKGDVFMGSIHGIKENMMSGLARLNYVVKMFVILDVPVSISDKTGVEQIKSRKSTIQSPSNNLDRSTNFPGFYRSDYCYHLNKIPPCSLSSAIICYFLSYFSKLTRSITLNSVLE